MEWIFAIFDRDAEDVGLDPERIEVEEIVFPTKADVDRLQTVAEYQLFYRTHIANICRELGEAHIGYGNKWKQWPQLMRTYLIEEDYEWKQWAQLMRMYLIEEDNDEPHTAQTMKAKRIEDCRYICVYFVKKLCMVAWHRDKPPTDEEEEREAKRSIVRYFGSGLTSYLRNILQYTLPMDKMNCLHVMRKYRNRDATTGLHWFGDKSRELLEQDDQWTQAIKDMYGFLPGNDDDDVEIANKRIRSMITSKYEWLVESPEFRLHDEFHQWLIPEMSPYQRPTGAPRWGFVVMWLWLFVLLLFLPISETLCGGALLSGTDYCEWVPHAQVKLSAWLLPFFITENDLRNVFNLSGNRYDIRFARIPLFLIPFPIFMGIFIIAFIDFMTKEPWNTLWKSLLYNVGLLNVIQGTGFSIIDPSCLLAYTFEFVRNMVDICTLEVNEEDYNLFFRNARNKCALLWINDDVNFGIVIAISLIIVLGAAYLRKYSLHGGASCRLFLCFLALAKSGRIRLVLLGSINLDHETGPATEPITGLTTGPTTEPIFGPTTGPTTGPTRISQDVEDKSEAILDLALVIWWLSSLLIAAWPILKGVTKDAGSFIAFWTNAGQLPRLKND